MMKNRVGSVAVVVDAFSSGRFYPGSFKKRGMRVVHVQSQNEVPDYFKRLLPDPMDIDRTLFAEGAFEVCVEELKKENPIWIIAGSEMGVELADQLSHRLGTVSHQVETLSSRRNKYDMAETLRSSGLDAVIQKKCGDLAGARKFALDLGRWPIVIKPIESALADGFSMAKNLEELEQAVTQLLGKTNAMGLTNREILLQEYMDGTEYVVNSVSWAGQHQTTDVWRVHKKIVQLRESLGTTKIYDFEDLVDLRDHEVSDVIHYNQKALSAIGVRHGPSHSEVMKLRMEGRSDHPVSVVKWIESGARLCGGLPPEVGQRCQGTSQFDFSVRVYASQGAEFESERAQLGKNLREHSRCMTLIAPRSGLLKEDPDWSGIRSLPSFFSLSSHLKKGETVSETRDLSTAPGIVFLVHPDRAQVERDYHRLRQWELEGLYESALRLGSTT